MIRSFVSNERREVPTTHMTQQIKETKTRKKSQSPPRGKSAIPVHKTGGLVRAYLRPATGRGASDSLSTSRVAERIQSGLPIAELDDLQSVLKVSMEELAPMLGISRATLLRRKGGGVLGPSESDRVVRYARLLGKAIDAFDSQDAARRWMMTPQAGLNGEVPLRFAQTEVGAREVEDLLGRIEYGVYS